MTEMHGRTRGSVDGVAVFAVFLLVVGVTYSGDIVEFAHTGAGSTAQGPRWLIAVIDIGLILSALPLQRYVLARAKPERRLDWPEFAAIVARSWWPVGMVLMVVVHVAMIFTPRILWVDLLGTLLSTVAMTFALVAALDISEGGRRAVGNSWIIPISAGTLIVQVASVLWFPVINVEGECADTISPEFFSQMVQVIPMLLITLGIELGYFRRARIAMTPGERAAPILTVVLLCLAEGLTFSMLVADDRLKCGLIVTLQEYAAFVVSIQATAVALATVVWLLFANADAEHASAVG